jgi:hypothetical protein
MTDAADTPPDIYPGRKGTLTTPNGKFVFVAAAGVDVARDGLVFGSICESRRSVTFCFVPLADVQWWPNNNTNNGEN